MELPIKRLTQELLDKVTHQARTRPRLRQNHDFHQPAEKVQRFINALQPGTYVRPHWHRRAAGMNGFEFFLVLRGDLGMILFDHEGQITHMERISAHGPTTGIELAEGTCHTLVALAADTALLELKEGPYNPVTDKEFLTDFPCEGTVEAQKLVEVWQGYFAETILSTSH